MTTEWPYLEPNCLSRKTGKQLCIEIWELTLWTTMLRSPADWSADWKPDMTRALILSHSSSHLWTRPAHPSHWCSSWYRKSEIHNTQQTRFRAFSITTRVTRANISSVKSTSHSLTVTTLSSPLSFYQSVDLVLIFCMSCDPLHQTCSHAAALNHSQHLASFLKSASASKATIRYDTIEEINVDSKAEYTA